MNTFFTNIAERLTQHLVQIHNKLHYKITKIKTTQYLLPQCTEERPKPTSQLRQ